MIIIIIIIYVQQCMELSVGSMLCFMVLHKINDADSTGELEDELVRQFDAALQHEYQKGDLAYAKAVSCLRLISVIKVSYSFHCTAYTLYCVS